VDRARCGWCTSPPWTGAGVRRGGGAAAAAPWPALRRLAVAALRGARRHAEGAGVMRAAWRARCAGGLRLGKAEARRSRGGGGEPLRRDRQHVGGGREHAETADAFTVHARSLGKPYLGEKMTARRWFAAARSRRQWR